MLYIVLLISEGHCVKRILIIQGHPDPDRTRFGYQLAEAYKTSAQQSDCEVKEIFVADLDFPLLRTWEDFYTQEPSSTIAEQQQLISWADHLVIFYPLWLGGMPALLKGFLEQVLRPGFALGKEEGKLPERLLKGKSARVVITMGMPAFIYRWVFHAHSLKSLQRNILQFCGIHPVKTSLIGLVEDKNPGRRKDWLGKMRKLGVRAA